ncbi:MAG: SGNH/GDSL hydrolase family protein [Pirellulales bacterium]|nr:SGNH/GDSL hydrolase family protein [Pirellulales bacterium]
MTYVNGGAPLHSPWKRSISASCRRPGLLVVAFFLFLFCVPPLAQAADAPLNVNGPPDAEGVYVSTKPEVPLVETAKAAAALPPLAYTPPADHWAQLPLTREILKNGGELRIVMLGDSIVNDTARSNWTFHLNDLYPNVKIIKYTVVRGSTGCKWYRAAGRVAHYVTDLQPHLVMIGGISHGDDTDAILDVIQQIRAVRPTDIVLMTGPFGTVDPRDAEQWKSISDAPADSYRARLAKLAAEEKCEFVDLQRAWGEFIRAGEKPVTDYKRDEVHANRAGEAVLGQILIKYFEPEKKR